LRSENVDSDHDIHSDFYKAQIEVEFTPPGPFQRMFIARNELVQAVFGRWGLRLFKLQGEIDKIVSNLHPPVFWDDKHVMHPIESLNRVFVESVDTAAVRADIRACAKDVDTKGKASLKLLEMWLQSRVELSEP